MNSTVDKILQITFVLAILLAILRNDKAFSTAVGATAQGYATGFNALSGAKG